MLQQVYKKSRFKSLVSAKTCNKSGSSINKHKVLLPESFIILGKHQGIKSVQKHTYDDFCLARLLDK